MNFLVKRGIEKDNFYEKLLHKVKSKPSHKTSIFSDKKEDLPLIKNVTGKISKGFVKKDESGRIVNRITGKS